MFVTFSKIHVPTAHSTVTYRTSVVISTFDMTLPASTSKTLEMSIESFVHWTNNPKGGLSEVDSVKFMTLK